jgi:hypothetical protein
MRSCRGLLAVFSLVLALPACSDETELERAVDEAERLRLRAVELDCRCDVDEGRATDVEDCLADRRIDEASDVSPACFSEILLQEGDAALRYLDCVNLRQRRYLDCLRLAVCDDRNPTCGEKLTVELMECDEVALPPAVNVELAVCIGAPMP